MNNVIFCFAVSQSVMVFETLKRGLNNNIQNIAKEWMGMDMSSKHLTKIYENIIGSVPSKEAIKQLNSIMNGSDADNDGKIKLQELISYLNTEYGTFQFHGNKGNIQLFY